MKWLELQQQRKGLYVTHYGVEPLPPEALSERAVKDLPSIVESIRRCQRRTASKAREAIIAIPGTNVVKTLVQMPAHLNEFEIEEQLREQSDDYLPHLSSDTALDFAIQGPSSQRLGYVDVTVVAAHQEQVDNRCEMISEAGLQPKIVDVESFAAIGALALAQEAHQQCVAIVDIGASLTHITIAQAGELCYHREHGFGGRQLTEEIMRHFGLPYEEAGNAKRSHSLPENYFDEVLQPFQHTLAQSIRRFLEIYRNTTDGPEPERILLAGGCANIVGIAEVVMQLIKTPVQRFNPLDTLMLHPRIRASDILEDGPALLVAAGLAMRALQQ